MPNKPTSKYNLNGHLWKAALGLLGAAILVFQVINFAQSQGDRSVSDLRKDIDTNIEQIDENSKYIGELGRDTAVIKTKVERISEDVKEIKEAVR